MNSIEQILDAFESLALGVAIVDVICLMAVGFFYVFGG